MMANDASYAAKKEQYLLKSAYVRRKIRTDDYYNMFREVNRLAEEEADSFSWDERNEWGISDLAWSTVKESGLEPILTFCHPGVLESNPKLLLYYRSIALLPQKGFQAIIRKNPVPYETGKKTPGSIADAECEAIASGLNEIISSTLEQGSQVTIHEISGMFFSQAGMTIDGSWRNQIGNEGQLLIWGMIARSLLDHGEIDSVSKQTHGEAIPLSSLDKSLLKDNWQDCRCLGLINGNRVLYASDPDVVLVDKEDRVLGAIEVKAGLDPAGALERTGAVLKSFESVLSEYPEAKTILVTSCETPESKLRLNESSAVHLTYETAKLTTNKSLQRKFITQIRKSLGLVE